MPRIVDKRKVSKRGAVVLYGSGSSAGQFFYRELIPGTKNYRTRRIEGVSSMDEAVDQAFEVATELRSEPDLSLITTGAKSQSQSQRSYQSIEVVSRKPRSQPIELAVKRWLSTEIDKVDAGLLNSKTIEAKERTFRLHVIPYLDSKEITMTAQIDGLTFNEYPIHRSSATPLVRRKEIMLIKEWCRNYLVKHRLMDSTLYLDSMFLPKTIIRDTDLMKNPAITPEDWKVIIDFVRDEWRKRPLHQENQSGWVFRNIFWHYLLFAKNTGMSPEEVLKLKWKQIEIIDEGRVNSKGERVKWEVAYVRTIRAKTQQAREIPANQARELQRWKAWLEQWIKDNRAKNLVITKDSYVFGDPRRYWKPFTYKHYGDVWRDIRNELKDKLNGHRFSPHPYTLYSLRSSFIEDQLMKGTPVMEVAQMAGHNIIETQKTYARLNLRRKGTELTLPELGKKQLQAKKVDLFND